MVSFFGKSPPSASTSTGPLAPASAPRANRDRGDEGFGAPPPGESGGGGGKKWNEFEPLKAGAYTFIASVGDICRLVTKTARTASTIVEWKVLAGEEANRPIGWNQSPAPNASGKGLAFWQRTIIGAYTAGGWSWDADPATGWKGWDELDGLDAEGKPRKVPPYDIFFVEQCADGIVVPVCMEIKINVDAGYEQYPKTVSVRRYLDTNGRPVQAPMPRRVPQWLATQHGWVGETVVGMDGVAHVRLDWKQIQLKHGGLTTYKDLK